MLYIKYFNSFKMTVTEKLIQSYNQETFPYRAVINKIIENMKMARASAVPISSLEIEARLGELVPKGIRGYHPFTKNNFASIISDDRRFRYNFKASISQKSFEQLREKFESAEDFSSSDSLVEDYTDSGVRISRFLPGENIECLSKLVFERTDLHCPISLFDLRFAVVQEKKRPNEKYTNMKKDDLNVFLNNLAFLRVKSCQSFVGKSGFISSDFKVVETFKMFQGEKQRTKLGKTYEVEFEIKDTALLENHFEHYMNNKANELDSLLKTFLNYPLFTMKLL